MTPSPRAFLIACVLSATCFLSAFQTSLEWLSTALAIGSLFLGIPICIVLYLDFVRALGEHPETQPHGLAAVVLGAPIVLLGSASLLLGFAIVLWVLYNTIVERHADYSGPPIFAGLGIGPLLIAFGWHLVRSSFKS